MVHLRTGDANSTAEFSDDIPVFEFLRQLSRCDSVVRPFCFYPNSESADRDSIKEI